MLLFTVMLYMLVRYESPRDHMCFSCMMFKFVRTYGVVLACFIASWT